MAYQIIWHDEAQTDIHEILTYLLDEWNESIAEKFSDYLLKTTSQLETHPFIGRQHKTLSSVRELPLKPHYLICYMVSSKTKEIHVLNVLDSRKRY